MKEKHPRRIYFVKPEAQLHWGLFVGLMSLFGILVTTAVTFIGPVLMDSISQTRTIETFEIVDLAGRLWPWFCGATFLYFVYAFVLATFQSHRLMGPIYRVEKLLKERRCGEPSGKVRLRKGDMLVEFFDVVTGHVDRMAVIERAAAQLIQTAAQSHALPEAMKSDIEGLQKALDQAFASPRPPKSAD